MPSSVRHKNCAPGVRAPAEEAFRSSFGRKLSWSTSVRTNMRFFSAENSKEKKKSSSINGKQGGNIESLRRRCRWFCRITEQYAVRLDRGFLPIREGNSTGKTTPLWRRHAHWRAVNESISLRGSPSRNSHPDGFYRRLIRRERRSVNLAPDE